MAAETTGILDEPDGRALTGSGVPRGHEDDGASAGRRAVPAPAPGPQGAPPLHADPNRSRPGGVTSRAGVTDTDPRGPGVGERLLNLPALWRIDFRNNRRPVGV